MEDHQVKGVSFHVAALLELVSPRDGVVDLWQGNNTRGQYFVYGDRAGLLRLGLAILKYASEAQPIRAGSAKAPAESLKNILTPHRGCANLSCNWTRRRERRTNGGWLQKLAGRL